MKKTLLGLLLVSMILALTACSTPNGNNSNVAPIIENAFFLIDTETEVGTKYLLENTSDWNSLEYLSSSTVIKSKKYLLLVIFNDPDVDVCEVESGWSKENMYPYSFKQSYSYEQHWFGYGFDSSDVFDSPRTFYIRIKDSNGNYSEYFEIKDLKVYDI